jgi:hypothetical protein
MITVPQTEPRPSSVAQPVSSRSAPIRGDFRAQIREFLGARRAKVAPEQAGLPLYGGERRRVTGLRREEVALLAGISSENYTADRPSSACGPPCSASWTR